MISPEQAQQLEQAAEHNNGKCTRCHQTIKMYRYRINETHARFLRAMAVAVKDTGVNDVDISTIGIAYSTRSQVSKLRFHGLIARIKDKRGKQVPRHWLITKKGWGFLHGDPIQSKVVIYDNMVMGHEGELVNIYQVAHEPNIQPAGEASNMTTAEASAYSDIRQPKKYMEVDAVYRGQTLTNLIKGTTYKLKIDKLQVGKPVVLHEPSTFVYRDVAAFQRDWRIV